MIEDGYIPPPPVARVRDAVSRRGVVPVLTHLARWSGQWLAGLPLTAGRFESSAGRFSLAGRSYPYLFHRHKHSWLTERTVEVPVVQTVVDDARARGGRILEVGNVLSHYRPQTHLVVDKYERAPGVVNRDALELTDLGMFDLIVAISTLEHVGHDELPREPGKALRAALALQAMLAPGGELVITLGVGYNAAFDAELRDGSLSRSRITAMRRVGDGRRWREVPADEVWSAPYDFLLYAAGGVVFVLAEAAAD